MKKIFLILLSFGVWTAFGQTATTQLLDNFESGDKGWLPVDAGWVEFAIVPNPAKDAVNLSNNVLKITRHTGTPNYSGVILRDKLSLIFGTFTGMYRYGKVKFYKPDAGEVTMKLENSGNEGSCSVSAQYTTANTWQEVTFDLGSVAAGRTYNDFFIQPAKDSPLNADVTVYIDDIVFETDPDATEPSDPNPSGTYQLVWADEFDGTALDESVWGYQLGRGEGNDNWGNNEQQFYTNETDNVFVENGMLTIRGKREDYTGWNPVRNRNETADYTSARILTRGKFFTTYGRIEARISMPVARGLWPAFWMMPENSVYGGWPKSGEIDIMEAKGRLPNQYGGAIHFGNPWPNNQYLTTGDYTFPENKTIEDFHIYAVEWEYGMLRWLCDDVVTGTMTSGWFTPEATFPAPFDRDFHIILNFAIGGNFDGNRLPPENWQSGDMKVDYVRVYKKSQTELENAQISDNFKIIKNENTLTVHSDDNLPFDVAVYSVTGQKILEQNGNKNIASINISSLNRSVYIINILDSFGSCSQKIIK